YDAAQHATVGDDLSHRESSRLAAVDDTRGPGAVFHRHLARDHAEGGRNRLPVGGDAGADGDVDRADGRRDPYLQAAAGLSMRILRFLLRKEFLQIVRDPVLMRMILIMPLVQLLVLAHAVTFEVRSARMYVVDEDHSASSRGLVHRLTASGRFVLAAATRSRQEADEAMLGRDADLILVIPHRFEEELVRGETAPVQFILNAEDGGAAAVIRSYATS